LGNVGVGVLLLAAGAAVVEGWVRWRRRPLYQLSLAEWFVALSAIGLLIHFAHSVVRQHHERMQLARQLDSAGFEVTFVPGGPDWLFDHVPNQDYRCFDRILEIRYFDLRVRPLVLFGDEPPSNARDESARTLMSLAKEHPDLLAEVESIHLNNCREIDDRALETLAPATRLRRLALGSTRITDRGLEVLATQIALEELYLWRTNITDDGLKHVLRLRNLKKLALDLTQATPKGIAELQRQRPTLSVTGQMPDK
jgi:hypothetical protein